jgi:hypothetical protein
MPCTAAGMLIMAGGNGKPLNYDELERGHEWVMSGK